eukprot:NODE_747_length_1933_cov_39.158705_g692_i0.p1 GENE.NODE_747_length_1933_cov_39.158705_g692_i0~~NODE_747_length_1933_cov_39.158705_g692_i0.p1  ORF type:complete len:570 (+),score=92.34 NODE_747_length_1933_cov_39.158705_g692_i0:101-1711(+)
MKRTERKPWLGFIVKQQPLREVLVITHVAEGGPAARGGLEIGDELLSLAGKRLKNVAAFRDAVKRCTPGRAVRLEVSRRAGQGRTMRIPTSVVADRRAVIPVKTGQWSFSDPQTIQACQLPTPFVSAFPLAHSPPLSMLTCLLKEILDLRLEALNATLFELADEDFVGLINAQEFSRAASTLFSQGSARSPGLSASALATELTASKLFHTADSDGSGFLTQGELLCVTGTLLEQVLDLMASSGGSEGNPRLGFQVRSNDDLGAGSGIIVEEVVAESPASHSGLLPGDEIARINESMVTDSVSFRNIVRSLPPGDPFTLLVRRWEEGHFVERELKVVADEEWFRPAVSPPSMGTVTQLESVMADETQVRRTAASIRCILDEDGVGPTVSRDELCAGLRACGDLGTWITDYDNETLWEVIADAVGSEAEYLTPPELLPAVRAVLRLCVTGRQADTNLAPSQEQQETIIGGYRRLVKACDVAVTKYVNQTNDLRVCDVCNQIKSVRRHFSESAPVCWQCARLATSPEHNHDPSPHRTCT